MTLHCPREKSHLLGGPIKRPAQSRAILPLWLLRPYRPSFKFSPCPWGLQAFPDHAPSIWHNPLSPVPDSPEEMYMLTSPNPNPLFSAAQKETAIRQLFKWLFTVVLVQKI